MHNKKETKRSILTTGRENIVLFSSFLLVPSLMSSGFTRGSQRRATPAALMPRLQGVTLEQRSTDSNAPIPTSGVGRGQQSES